jgi:Holliday junction DNA helicase RuvA
MIGKLSGIVDTIGEDYAILDVQGVGYLVHCSARTLAKLQTGEAAKLAIETYVREDAIRLYGFATEAERGWFQLLQTVQGVGAKVALALLGALGTGELAAAIAHQDKAQIARAPGIGPRLAARLTAELKDKLPTGMVLADLTSSVAAQAAVPEPPAAQDAITALLTLGYGRPQALDAVSGAVRALGESADTAALIRRALQDLSR